MTLGHWLQSARTEMALGHWLQSARTEMALGHPEVAIQHLNEALRIALYVCMWPVTDQNVRKIQNMRHSAFQERRVNQEGIGK